MNKKAFYGDSEAALATKAIYEQGYIQAIEDAAKVLFCQEYQWQNCDCLACDWIKEIKALSGGSR